MHCAALQHRPEPHSFSLAQLTSQLVPRQLVGPEHAPTAQERAVCLALLVREVPQVWLAVQWIWQSFVASVHATCPQLFTSSQWMSHVLALHTTELPQALVPEQVTLQESPAH